MKRLFLTALLVLVLGTVSVFARGYHYYRPYRYHYGYSSWSGPVLSFSFGTYPYSGYSYCPPAYSSAYPVYPGYGYGYAYSRPNYAVSGTLLGALTGGLIGDSIHHQGWEGAGIGAAAGLLLGSLAEHSARVNEQAYYAPPTRVNVQPNPSAPAPASAAPAVADPPRQQFQAKPAYRPAASDPMSAANSLFGR